MPLGYVPIAGTARRLQALAVIGWSCPMLATEWGCAYQQLARWRVATWRTIHRLNAAFIATHYAELCGTPGGDAQTMRWAGKRGYWGPERWRGLDMDDPAAGSPVRPYVPRGRVDLDEIAFLRRCGLGDQQIAHKLGVQEKTMREAEARAQKKMNTEGVSR